MSELLSPCAGKRQRLGAADRAMLVVDRALRSLGYTTFQTQTLLWLAGRLDPQRLQAALQQVALHYPVISARLRDGAGDRPCWECPSAPACALTETHLESSETRAVHDHAGLLMSEVHDPAETPPLRFHLLRRPNGHDVLLLHYCHTLMDHAAVRHVLREIDRCWHSPESTAAPKQSAAGDPILAYLKRFPHEQRRQAARSHLNQWLDMLHHGAVQLGCGVPAGSGPVKVRLATRSLDAEAMAALQRRLQAAGGMQSMSMALLASAFRAVARLASKDNGRTDLFHAGIGVDLGLRRPGGPLFANLMSMVPLFVRSRDLADRDQLVRLLSKQLRDQLATGADLAMLRFATTFACRPRRAHWMVDLFLRYGYSLWYAYFGPLDIDDSFCGTPVEEVFSVGPCWPTIGVTLLVNQFRGRLLFQASYVPAVVPEPMAHAFLDTVLADLRGKDPAP
jgi:hypothetical protein